MTNSFKLQKLTDNSWLNCIRKSVTQLYYYQFPSKEKFEVMYCLKFLKTVRLSNYETLWSLIQVKLMISSKRSQKLIQKKMTISLSVMLMLNSPQEYGQRNWKKTTYTIVKSLFLHKIIFVKILGFLILKQCF